MSISSPVRGLITSESVCAGHPDKICDQISDAIVDAVLDQDPYGRVAVETMVTKDFVCLSGEIHTTATIDPESIARQQILRLGYVDSAFDFTDRSPVVVKIHTQSPEIATGVDQGGAGDQGMMYGYATDETLECMPLAITLAHQLARTIDTLRESQVLPYLRPDGKTQVTVNYDHGKPVSIEHVVVAVPHHPDINLNQVTSDIYTQVVLPILDQYHFSIQKNQLLVNGTGVWHYGGPAADTGVTGRKIVVDSYGGYARVGGGAFSGKDPTKVDRSGAYYARYIAKSIVKHGLASAAEVRLAYAIGKSEPLALDVDDFGTLKVGQQALKDFVHHIATKTVRHIIDDFHLRTTKYLPTAAYGHFGRPEFPWEQVGEVE